MQVRERSLIFRSFAGARSRELQSGLSLSKRPGPRLLINVPSRAGTQPSPCLRHKGRREKKQSHEKKAISGANLEGSQENHSRNKTLSSRAPNNRKDLVINYADISRSCPLTTICPFGNRCSDVPQTGIKPPEWSKGLWKPGTHTGVCNL